MFYNNIFTAGKEDIFPDVKNPAVGKPKTGYGLNIYNDVKLPMQVNGNIYYFGAQTFFQEENYVQMDNFNPNIRIEDDGRNTYLHVTLDKSIKSIDTPFVTSELLGTVIVSQQGFTTPEGSYLKIDSDYFGRNRDQKNPVPGPFERLEADKTIRLKVW